MNLIIMNYQKRKVFVVCILLLFVFSLNVIPAIERPRCINCGMYSDLSQTRIVEQFKKEKKQEFCCFKCFYKTKLKKNTDLKNNPMMYDFSNKKMFDIKKGFFLIESKIKPAMSMRPYIIGFASRENAEKFSKKYKGRVLNFKELCDSLKH